MTGILLNHLPHHTYVPCSLVRYAVYFPKLPLKKTVPFDSPTEQLFFPYKWRALENCTVPFGGKFSPVSLQMGSANCLLFSLGTGCTFSRAYYRLHIFPLLAPVPYFPALSTGYIFSRAWRRLHIFSRLALVACVCYKF